VRIISQVITDAISDAAAASDDEMNAGNIPAELSQLSSLQELRLDSNKLSGNDAISDAAAASDDDMNREYSSSVMSVE